MILGLTVLFSFLCIACIILIIEIEDLRNRVEMLEKHIEKFEVKKDEIGAE